MAKNIIFCADGTWNDPRQDEDQDQDQVADPTNVYKLFVSLDGVMAHASMRAADEQESALTREGSTVQVAKYINGVGDSRNPIIKLMGGAFGAGLIARIVRGYTFISRHYTPGDRIVIAGFSRGAYTARALAGLIAVQGLLAPKLTEDREAAYRRGAQAWYRYRQASGAAPLALARLFEVAADLPAFLTRSTLQPDDLIPVDQLHAVAVWDTVGALGMPQYRDDARIDAFRFADTVLSPKVRHGFHAVALDEKREDFAPALWTPGPGIEQMVFPGAHADVGGGYPTANNESGLSDLALQWMSDRLRSAGVLFTSGAPYPLSPDPAGTAHKPWAHPPWSFPGVRIAARVLPASLQEHPSVDARRQAGEVLDDPAGHWGRYQPDKRRQ